jgi:hypothetical protein
MSRSPAASPADVFKKCERAARPGSVLSRPHHVRLHVGGIGECPRRRLLLIEFIGIDPAAAIEGLVLGSHAATGQEGRGGKEQQRQDRDSGEAPGSAFRQGIIGRMHEGHRLRSRLWGTTGSPQWRGQPKCWKAGRSACRGRHRWTMRNRQGQCKRRPSRRRASGIGAGSFGNLFWIVAGHRTDSGERVCQTVHGAAPSPLYDTIPGNF